MKIVYLHQYFKTPHMSGGTRSYEMARRMVIAGHEVHMVTSRTDSDTAGDGWEREQIDGIDVHWLPIPYDNSMSYPRRILAFFQFAIRAARRAASIDADVIFATSTPLTIALPAVWAKWRRKIPMVFEVRDLWPELPIAMGALKNPAARRGARWLERWAYANASHVIGLSPGMCDGVSRTGYPAERLHCIPNSCDTALFDVPAEAGKAFRNERGWLGDRPLVLYAGTFGKINGVGYLADLAAAMIAIDPEVRFLALGHGAEFATVREKAEMLGVLGVNFFMEGPVPKNAMPDVLSAATVGTSLFIPVEPMWHNSANKFFDTLAAGRPIAVNHGGWQAELITETGCGLVLDSKEPAIAARTIFNFLNAPQTQEVARRSAFALASERFDRDKLAQKLIRILEESCL